MSKDMIHHRTGIEPLDDAALPDLYRRADTALDFAGRQIRQLVTRYPDYFPLFTTGGKWRHDREAWTNWCEGFLGGMLWILARRRADPWYREQAEHYSLLIEHRKTDRTVHDLGFLFLPTWKVWYELTQDPAKKQVVIEAGPDASSPFPKKRALSSLVRGARKSVHRHHDERRTDFLYRKREAGRCTVEGCSRALLDH
jgi:unsaturated chondroitin disaccharide hydrolase